MDPDKIQWMHCTQCHRAVVMSAVGICLACTGKYIRFTQPDSYENIVKEAVRSSPTIKFRRYSDE